VNGPGFLRASLALAAKELRVEWRTWETFSSSFVFCLVVLLVYQFALGESAVRELGVDRVAPGALWIAIGFAAVIGISRSMLTELQDERLAGLFRAPVDRGALFFGKFLANACKLALLDLCLLPLTILFYDVPFGVMGLRLLAVVALGSIGLCALGTLFGAVVARVGRGEALLAILLLPAATPLLLGSIHATAEVFRGGGLATAGRWVGLVTGFDLLYFFLALATFEYALEE